MWRRLAVSLLIFLSSLEAEEKKTTICLNMIVKNERDVIRRCLDSVKSIIDYWVIVDIGSTDGTQDIIREYLKGIPGELHERRSRNSGFNRTQALKLAKGKADYLLFMVASDTLEFTKEFSKAELTHDFYYMWHKMKDFSSLEPQLVRSHLPCKWVGVIHEYLACEQECTSKTLENVRNVKGECKDFKKKCLTNVRLLLNGLKKEPNNSRYVFYVAESYRGAGEKGKALEWYQKRIAMGGWEEEVFWSKFQIGLLLSDLGVAPNLIIEAYKDAHYYRPHRLEPIYYIAEMLNHQGRHGEAYDYLKAASLVPKLDRKDLLLNGDWIEEYGLPFQLSIASSRMGQINN